MRLLFIIVMSGLFWTGPALAKQYALLVGVNDYPQAEGISALKGPENDVALMQSSLAGLWKYEAHEFRLLLGPDATKQNILYALAALADEVGAEDAVTVFLAGHGAQLPSNAEPDGFDEVFLPADFLVRRTKDAVSIRNHIVDDEFGAAFAKIRATGAFLWLIADICHAGTIDRNSGDVRARFALLGLRPGQSLVDENPQSSVIPNSTNDPLEPTNAEQAGFVGFYAADEASVSLEMPLGDDQSGTNVHGLFTYELSQALTAGAGTTFGSLSRAVARRFADWGASAPRPAFSGAMATPITQQTRAQSSVETDSLRFGIAADPKIEHSQAKLIEAGFAQSKMRAQFQLNNFGAEPEIVIALADGRLSIQISELRGTAPTVTLSATTKPEAPLRALDRLLYAGYFIGTAKRLTTRKISGQLSAQLLITPCASNEAQSYVVRHDLAPPVVHHCDSVTLRLTNHGPSTIEANPFYVGPSGKIYFLDGYAGSHISALRLEPNETKTIEYVETLGPSDPAGDMALVTLVKSHPVHSHSTDLRDLAFGNANFLVDWTNEAIDDESSSALIVPLRTTR